MAPPASRSSKLIISSSRRSLGLRRCESVSSARQSAGRAANFCNAERVRVLIAGDQKNVETTLAALVQTCGHEVVAMVGSGFDAIQAYARHRPDVVLMDYQMPRLNGATACRYILARDPAARIILISDAPTTDLTDSGAVAILSKPITLDRIYAALYDAARPSSVSPDDKEG